LQKISTNSQLHLVDLWRNRALCRQLGTAARATLDSRDCTASALRSLVPI
jgi:hypothetical protein